MEAFDDRARPIKEEQEQSRLIYVPGRPTRFLRGGLILRVVALTLALSVVFTAIVSFPANPSFAILNPNSRTGTHRSQTGESNCHQPYLLHVLYLEDAVSNHEAPVRRLRFVSS